MQAYQPICKYLLVEKIALNIPIDGVAKEKRSEGIQLPPPTLPPRYSAPYFHMQDYETSLSYGIKNWKPNDPTSTIPQNFKMEKK